MCSEALQDSVENRITQIRVKMQDGYWQDCGIC